MQAPSGFNGRVDTFTNDRRDDPLAELCDGASVDLREHEQSLVELGVELEADVLARKRHLAHPSRRLADARDAAAGVGPIEARAEILAAERAARLALEPHGEIRGAGFLAVGDVAKHVQRRAAVHGEPLALNRR